MVAQKLQRQSSMQETSMKDEKETVKMAARIYAEAKTHKIGSSDTV